MEEYDVESILDMYEDSYVREPSAMAQGGRIPFAKAKSVQKSLDVDEEEYVPQKKPVKKSKSAVRKPFAPEIEKRIIELHQNEKLGAQAIADKLTEEFGIKFSRAPIGKRITALKEEGLIKEIPYKERKASIDQRGDFYNKPAGEKYLAIREVTDIDRKTRFKDTGKLKYNIPKDAKFKVDFKNPGVSGADVSDIPEKFRGIQYFKTKKDAEAAVAERKKLKLKADVDPDKAKRSANKKKYDLVKEVSNNNIERVLANFKKGQPIEQAHRLSLNQVKKTGEMYNVMNLGLDFDDPEFVEINNKFVKPYENKLKQLYTEQNKLYEKAKNLKTIPKELQKLIEINNKKISAVVDLSGGRVQGLQLDELTLKPKVYGTNYANVLGFGIYDKPVKELTDIDRAEIAVIMEGQIQNEKKTAGKTAKKLFENTELLNDLDRLIVSSDGVTLGANYVPKKLLTKTLGDMAISLGSPTALLGLNAYLGVDPRESLDRAVLGAEAALAPSGIKALTSRLANIKNPLVRKGIETAAGLRLPGVFTPANVLRAARFASPVGIATLAGEGLYQLGKLGYKEQQMINEMRENDPEAYQRYLAEQQELADVSA
jgi:hypothetical protein